MIAQHQEQSALPNFMHKPISPPIQDELSSQEDFINWIWPAICFILVIFNLMMGIITIKNMWELYKPFDHLFYVFNVCLTFLATAFVYKVILRGR